MDAPTWTGSRSPVSRLLLLWFSPLLKLGYQRPLQQDDCAPLEPHLQAASVYPALAKAWQQRLEDATYSDQGATIVEKLHSGTEAWLLAGTLLRLHWRRVAPAVSLQLLGSALAFSGPLLLHQLVVFMQAEGRQSAEEVTQAYGMVVLMCLLPAVAALCTAHGWCRLIAVQASVRAQLTCTLFRKAMQLSNRSRQQMELGKIVNLMSADATTVTNFFNGPCTLLIVSPLTIVTALVLLWFQISWAALIGLGVLSLSTPTAHQLVRRLSRVRKQMLVHTDERIKKMNQLLAGIRVLKLYAWEAAQEAAVLVARREELGQLRQAIRFRLGMNLLHFTSPIIAAVCSFGVYGAVAGDQFTAPRIFAAIALFSLIRAPLTRLPFSLVQATNAWVSLKRLSQVASGKSSLLSALLGDMELHGGCVQRGGSVAYVGQQAWIAHESLQDNILFGRPFVQRAWEQCVHACCLDSDLKMLPGGAATEIGEKGINLSGGQKQRVSLARAVYQDADLYLMDDPLSAVDVHVGKHIFDHCIMGALRHKTRVLVTNQLQYLAAADQDLNKMEVAITLTEERPHQSSGHEAVPEGSATGHADDSSDKGGNDSDPDEGRPLLERATLSSAAGTTAGTAGRNGSVPRGAGAGGGKAGGLMTKEDREVGQVRLHVYQRYFGRAYGLPSLVTILLLWSGEQSLRLLTNWWLARWTGAETDHHRLKAQGIPAPSPRNHFIAGYFCFAMVLVVCTAIRLAVNLLAAWRAARRIHQETLHAVTRAPVSFFDTTPTGRILNRFARDLDDMDYMLPQSITQLGNCLVQLAASFTFVCILQPAFLLGLLPLLTLYYFLQRFYRRSSVELLRLEAVSRSPMYAGFSESLSGVETIRAYGRVEHFAARHDSQVNANNRAYWGLRMAEQWLSMRLDLIGATLVLLAAGLAVAARNRVAAVLLALGLAEVLDATQFLKQAVQAAANFEGRLASVERLLAYQELLKRAVWAAAKFAGQLTSVERLLAYQEAGQSAANFEGRLTSVKRLLAYQEVPQEAPRSIEGRQPPPDWPLLGALSYQGVWMRYRPTLEPVLKAVSFSVAGGEKIGIVGRTGCGKSSLILTLFRIVEPYAGTVTLDGLNLLSLGLDDVRGRLAAIPQDPLLFSGSVRSNLDPYSRYTDSELWAALGQVALKEVVAAHPQGLSATVAEGGDNWSVGQRQLLCVARALLRRPVLLVLDEATASVDGQTDALIQRTLRANFQRSTVLTIAHRLNTIMDSDKVLVLEAGRVVEFDTVARLQQDMASAFHGMISQAYTH
ncbi:hypothetical protein WJX72_003514 [[Myrmecia] bisecta]|uniref:Uncharacterized protein n=1 Tax=[Myrmecia] bisecta TaxID=41462 RepID=A0AAW1QQ32_9CHLO